jgi:pimeloyl-ACP methyl ester carboxylesterase
MGQQGVLIGIKAVNRTFEGETMSNLINQQKVLITGRKIGFAEYGDPAGKPVFVIGDVPGSRIFGKHFELAAGKLHLRLIAIDPPGVGLSDPRPGYRLLVSR